MQALLQQIVSGRSLTAQQSAEAFELIMSGQAEAAQVGALLGMMAQRGASDQEIVGAARVMRAKATRVETPAGLRVVDTCGTGGDASHTFNISTATALVVAGAGRSRGLAVAKHGNRSVTSKSGSSQVLEALGVRLETPPDRLTRCLSEAGICFCFAPQHHPAMRHAMPVRQALGFRTIFNLLGPLTNPAGARRQLLGVFSASLTNPLAQALRDLGSEEAMVVHGQLDAQRGLDEISITGTTRVAHLRTGEVRSFDLDPREWGLTRADPAALQVDSPQSSAAMIREVLAGKAGAPRDVVCLNAAGALIVGGVAGDWREGLAMGREAIDSGAAGRALETLVRVTQG